MSPLRRHSSARRAPATAPDPRVWGRNYRGPRPWIVGLMVALIALALGYLAFVKELPFGDGYELHASFENAATLREDAPVRIAGVDVGEVTSVELDGEVADVTFTVDDDGRPIHDDASVEIRPRLFLEGNFFLELRPGSPSGEELPDGGTIPVTQTSTAVQVDEVLAALDSNTRRNFQRLLSGFGTGLTYQPTALDDAGQDPDVAGETAAESLNDAFRYGGPAGRDTAIVSDALQGESGEDLAGLIRAQRDLFGRLSGREAELQGLISNLNTTAGALAAESASLRASLRQLAPTSERAAPALAALSEALPPIRALALELRPSLEELPGTIRAAGPWLRQTGALLRRDELGGTARLLAEATPGLAKTTRSSLGLFPELSQLSRCATGVLLPTGDTVINDADSDQSTGESNFNEFWYAMVNLAGESQNFDGNGPYLRVQSGGGDELLEAPLFPGSSISVFGNSIEPPDGVQPELPAELPPFRMDVPCPRNPVPNINGPAAAPGPPDLVPAD